MNEEVDAYGDYNKYNDEMEETEEEKQERIEKEWNPLLVNSSIKGRMADVEKALSKGADINYLEKKSKWSSLIWASCKGHTDIVR